MTIKFARRLFLIAGIYGLAVIVPLFFMESVIAEHDPPPITHPGFYYGFACTALAWQLVYLLMARDPARYRLMLIPACVGKAGFAISAFVLLLQGRLKGGTVMLASIDLLWAGLLVWAFFAMPRTATANNGQAL